MPLAAEILRSIRGALRIALLDPDAPAWFNLSLQGFWRSFLAPVLLAPLYFVAILQDVGPVEEEANSAALATARIASYAVGWLAFPLLMIPISRLLQLGGFYVSYIIMWNWSAVPQAAIVVPTMVAADLVSARAAGMLFMLAAVTVLSYSYLVARAGLRCPPITATGVVALDLVLSLLVNSGSRALLL